jgi:hypothetical protein
MTANRPPYMRQGTPVRCALCHAPFIVEDEHIKCWRGQDHRHYRCREHADFELDKLLATLDPLGRRAS